MFVVAEVGMNHMGDTAYGDAYVRGLAEAHPDGVTFQVREPAFYAKQSGVHLNDDYYGKAREALGAAGIRFGVGLCDPGKLAFFESIGTDFYKILSKDIGDDALVDSVLATGKPVYVSTGMSDEGDIAAFLRARGSTRANLSFIHTQLSYVDSDTNLRAVATLRNRFGVPVAFGSHSTSKDALYASLGFDPSALFFYVKGDRPIEHRDEDHAIPLSATRELIETIRRLETMLGTGTKTKMENRIAAQRT